VLKDVPVPRLDPPEEAAYQSSVPAEAVAESVTDPVPQLEAGVVEVTAGTVLMVAATAVLAEVQDPSVVSA
jgi:hypothetical protein